MIEEVLFNRITTGEEIIALIGTRMYPNEVPQKAEMPCIAYKQVMGNRTPMMDEPAGMVHAEYEMTCWANSYSEAKSLFDEVRLGLDGYEVDAGGGIVILKVFVDDERDVPAVRAGVDKLRRYGKEMSITVWYIEAIT